MTWTDENRMIPVAVTPAGPIVTTMAPMDIADLEACTAAGVDMALGLITVLAGVAASTARTATCRATIGKQIRSTKSNVPICKQ